MKSTVIDFRLKGKISLIFLFVNQL